MYMCNFNTDYVCGVTQKGCSLAQHREPKCNNANNRPTVDKENKHKVSMLQSCI